MASGHVNRANRPNTWLLRPMLQREDSDMPCPRRHVCFTPANSTGQRNTLQSYGVRKWGMVTSRNRVTGGQKAELWERWKNGQSAAAISRALERKNKTGVERIVVVHGGIVPAPRQRALAALRLEEREEISRGIAVGRPIRQIAQRLRRAPSTVSREIKRNGGRQVYRANWAACLGSGVAPKAVSFGAA